MDRKRKIVVGLAVFSFFSISPVFGVTANISQLVFTTDVQIVEPNTLSKVITVQTQNSGGASEDVDETNDVEFVSTSGTGEFLNDKGSAVSKTMSKGTASRNFYYKDSATGEATLTVKITGRTSGKSFSANQKITIGTGSTGANGSTNTGTGNTNATSGTSESVNTGDASVTGTTGSSGGGSYSSYSTATNVQETLPFEIGAGRPRLTSVGSPVLFVVQASGKSDISGGRFVWSFGDGTSAEGLHLTHIYGFPGEYSVVLNGDRNGKEAVSRTTVKVIEPKLALRVVPGGVEITNKSATEINIGEWGITDGKETKLIPRDTIIFGNHSITIPQDVLKISLYSIALVNGVKQTVASAASPYVLPIAESNAPVPLVEISAKLEKIKQTLLTLQDSKQKRVNTNSASIVQSVSQEYTTTTPPTTTRSTFFDRVNHLFQSP